MNMIGLYESLLDDFEDMEKSQDKDLIKRWCEENITGDYNVVVLKNRCIKLRGNAIIKNYNDETFPYVISAMNGNLTIEKCPNIISLEGLFAEFLSVEGNFSINNCGKLNTLKGCPFSVKGSFSITGNKSLKSLEGGPSLVFGNVYAMKNGKKFSLDKLKEKYNVATRIVCSLEDSEDLVNEEFINEAINEPHLLELVDQLKKDKISTSLIFNQFNLEWDQIDSSQVHEYIRIDNAAKTKIRNIIAQRGNQRGLILLWSNVAKKYTHIISHRKDIISLGPSLYTNDFRYPRPWVDKTSTALMQYVDSADSVVIIDLTTNDLLNVQKKQADRRKSREGVVYNTPEYYEQVARENIERYKKIIIQNKTIKKNDNIEKIDADIELIVSSAFKYAQNIRKQFKHNPNNPNNHYFETSKIENIMNEIYDKKHWVGYNSNHSRDGYAGSEGLLSLYDQYMRSYMRTLATNEPGDSRRLNGLEKELTDKIRTLKRMLNI